MSVERVVLVTGGVRGIGRAVARRLAASETALVITHANPDSPGLKEAAEELSSLAGAFEVQCWPAEDSAAAGEAVASIARRYGRLDVLVNNAGLVRDGLAIRMSDCDFRRVVEVDLLGVFFCARAAAKIMLKQRSGRIVNVSSVVAFTGNVGQVNYSAAKAGVIGLTKSLALELAPRGVTVNAVAPGFIETDMTDVLDDKVKAGFLSKIPLGAGGRPEDVAEAVAFLASDGAAYITGQTLHVNGGLHM
ncbi:MAG: 3-oxoacyl-[acyl-carrier-protein] reductase [Deltaproteobacteria bacterium]|jgi:3-oxoacyl-[acyl-carrier protein] reductase|nr:3-oxoacyl-[acyl-carrier-protein] reductase [Deltaproteobacteria bacterium]